MFVKDFEAHNACKVTASPPSEPLITQKEFEYVINNFKRQIINNFKRALNKRKSSRACALGLLLTLLIQACDKVVIDLKILSFHLSIDVIFITLSFFILDPIYPTPSLGQDMTQGQFLSGV